MTDHPDTPSTPIVRGGPARRRGGLRPAVAVPLAAAALGFAAVTLAPSDDSAQIVTSVAVMMLGAALLLIRKEGAASATPGTDIAARVWALEARLERLEAMVRGRAPDPASTPSMEAGLERALVAQLAPDDPTAPLQPPPDFETDSFAFGTAQIRPAPSVAGASQPASQTASQTAAMGGIQPAEQPSPETQSRPAPQAAPAAAMGQPRQPAKPNPAFTRRSEAKAQWGTGSVPPVTARRSPQTLGLSPEDAAILEAVRDALRQDRVDVFLQPIVSLPQRKTRFFEAFSRVRGTDGRYLPAERYLPVAERTGLLAAVDELLLFRTVRLIRETQRRRQTIGFFVNVAAPSLADDRFMGEFAAYLADHGGLSRSLTFEVAQADVNAGLLSAAPVRRLVELGCHFSMDRVQSLDIDPEALARLDVRYVKLDAGTLVGLAQRPGMFDMVLRFKRAIESHPIDVIVEHIATEEQLVELLEMRVDFGQGHLFGPPQPSRVAGG